MFIHIMRPAVIAITVLLASSARPLGAQGITQQQADAILQELKAMRTAIERLAASTPGRPNAPGPAANEPVTLTTLGPYVLGAPNAPVTIVEFTDLQCPFCNRFATTTFGELKRHYIDTGQVRFVSRDLPLPIHPHAMRAAKAARCAGEQHKFWEMRSALVRDAAALSPELMTERARSLELDMASFDRCIASSAFDRQIGEDMAAAKAIGITGTPTFVIGKTAGNSVTGTKLVGAQPLAAFEARIKSLMPAPAPSVRH